MYMDETSKKTLKKYIKKMKIIEYVTVHETIGCYNVIVR